MIKNKVFPISMMLLLVLASFSFAQEMNADACKLYNEGNSLLKAFNYNGAIENYDNTETGTAEDDVSAAAISSCDAANQVLNYAVDYVGTGYGGEEYCSAAAATSGTCTTQCGSFVSSVWYSCVGG